jgi:tetratricopeptide (TPR) repeat protein
MGKSHMAAQLAREALSQGVRVAYGAAQSASSGTPYLPWRQIFYDLLDVEGQDEAETVNWLARYAEQRQPQWSVRLPLLGDLLGVPVKDNPTTAALSSDVRQEALFSLLAEMARWEARQQPLLLVVDNVQWMDEASRELTMALARGAVSAAPIFLLLLERSDQNGAAPKLASIAQVPGYSTVQLHELQEAAVAELVAERLPPATGAPPAPLLVSVVHQVSRGNPFIVGELLAALRDGEQLEQRVDGSWQVGDTLLSQLQQANVILLRDGEWRLRPEIDFSKVPLGLPDSIHGLILSRLDRLPEAPKMTLKVCSVVGYLVDLLLVASAHPEQKTLDRIRTESEELCAQTILRKEQPQRDIYAFAHHTTQEVVYETLLYNQRRQLHRALAQTLVELQPDAVTPIAYHAYLGQEWALSMRYNLQAGERAKQLHANQQALAFLERALESCRHVPHEEMAEPLKRLNLALGELSVQMGRHDEAEGYLHAALWLAREEGDHEGEASAHRWVARSHEQRGDYALALEVIEKGLAALQDELSPEAAELYLIAGLIKARQGQFEQALDYCRHSLETAELLDDMAIRARTYNLMGIVELRNDSAAAIQRFSQSLAQYTEIGDIYGQATSHNLIANGHFALGSWAQADRHYRQALDLFTQTGNLYKQVLVNNNLGGIALKQGRLETALAYYERAVEQLEQSGGSLWVLGALHLNVGHVLLDQDHLQEAREELELARDYFDQVKTRDLLPELLGLLAELAFRRGELAEAERVGEESLAMAREMAMPREEGHTLRVLGEVAQAQGVYRAAEDYFHDSYLILRGAGDQYEWARTQFSLAALYGEMGRVAEARRQLNACETVFRRLEARLDMEKVRALWPRLRVVERVT